MTCEAQTALSPSFGRTPMGFPLSSLRWRFQTQSVLQLQLAHWKEDKKPQCDRRYGSWNVIPSRIFPPFVLNTVTTLTLSVTSYLKYSFHESWVLGEFAGEMLFYERDPERRRELSATLVCHVPFAMCLISGFESHLPHSQQQGWFSSVKITRPQAPGCMFPCLKKKAKSVLELFLLRPQHQSVVTAHRPCWETGNISLLQQPGKLPSAPSHHQISDQSHPWAQRLNWYKPSIKILLRQPTSADLPSVTGISKCTVITDFTF